jgi:hypothetical protein
VNKRVEYTIYSGSARVLLIVNNYINNYIAYIKIIVILYSKLKL